MGAITSLEAKTAKTIVATFETMVPDSAVFTLTREDGTDAGAKATVDVSKTSVTFTSEANYTPGVYTFTATLGDNKVSKTVEVKKQSVQEIVINSKTALTSKDRKKVYVYYDVLDQYGVSMRASTSVTWTSGGGKVQANKSTGCLTIQKSTNEEFKYGDNVYIIGVDVKSAKNVQATLPVGMERALNSVKFEGFISKIEKNEILKTLPVDFAKDRYLMLYTAYDQDGNEMDASEFADAKSPKVTFIGDNPMLVRTDFKEGGVVTFDGKEYSSVQVNPGMYVDAGGEINITAISNTTGNKTEQNYAINAGARLQSLELEAPSHEVADGDRDVVIPYTAKDTNGNKVENYETIARSTQTLKLTATEGTLKVEEDASGKAVITWSDGETHKADNFTDPSSYDEVDRNVSLVTVVVGGESNNTMLYVSDTRRPVAVASVKLNADNNDTIAENNKADINLFDTSNIIEELDVTYVDQYGRQFHPKRDKWKVNAFFKQAQTANGFNGHAYGVKVDYTTVKNLKVDGGKLEFLDNNKFRVFSNSSKLTIESVPTPVETAAPTATTAPQAADATSKEGLEQAANDSIKYSVVRLDGEGNDKYWNMVDAEKNINYTIVPVKKLSNLRINDIKKVRIITEYSEKVNGEDIKAASSSAIAVAKKGNMPDVDTNDRKVVVAGTYDGKTVTIPSKYYDTTDNTNKTFEVKNGVISGIYANPTSASAITYGDLYDFNSAKNIRKDVKRDVSALVYLTSNKDNWNKNSLLGTVKTSVAVSDSPQYVAKITFSKPLTLRAVNTGYDFRTMIPDPDMVILDQYGDSIKNEKGIEVEYSISNISENNGELSHLPKSFAVGKNNSVEAELTGVEIKDTFDLTATVKGTYVSDTVKVTMGSDSRAYIDSTGFDEYQENSFNGSGKRPTLRDILGYDR